MEENKEWICSCGCHNVGNFCKECGKPRPAGGQDTQPIPTVSENTVTMPPVQPVQQPIQPPLPQQPVQQPIQPLPQQPMQAVLPNGNGGIPPAAPAGNRNTVKYLAAVAVVLLLAVIGIYAYVSGSEERYIAKCEETQKVVLDLQSTLKDVKDLKGDPDGDDTKDYLKRLKTATDNLKSAEKSIAGARVSEKYKDSNKALQDSLSLEMDILNDMDSVLKTPLADDSAAAVKRIRDNVTTLSDTAGKIKIEHTDFSTAMQLGNLADDLNKYIGKKKELDAARRAEQLRQEQAAKAARIAEFRKQLNDKNQQLMNNADNIEWITTNVTKQGASLVVDGFFYGAYIYPIVRVDSMPMTVTLKTNGQEVGSYNTTITNRSMNGFLRNGGRSPQKITIYNVNAPDFETFDVDTGVIYYTYNSFY